MNCLFPNGLYMNCAELGNQLRVYDRCTLGPACVLLLPQVYRVCPPATDFVAEFFHVQANDGI